MNTYWRKMGLSAVAAAVLLVAAAVVWSQQPRAPRPPGQGGFPGGPPPGGFQGDPPPDGFGPGRRGPGGPGAPGGPRPAFGPFGPFGRELNLTDDQRTQIQKIQQSFQQGDLWLAELRLPLAEPIPGGVANLGAEKAREHRKRHVRGVDVALVAELDRGADVVITEGLVRQCTSDGQLAAVLCTELGRLVSEREALAPPSVRKPERLPVSFGSTSSSRARLMRSLVEPVLS